MGKTLIITIPETVCGACFLMFRIFAFLQFSSFSICLIFTLFTGLNRCFCKKKGKLVKKCQNQKTKKLENSENVKTRKIKKHTLHTVSGIVIILISVIADEICEYTFANQVDRPHPLAIFTCSSKIVPTAHSYICHRNGFC